MNKIAEPCPVCKTMTAYYFEDDYGRKLLVDCPRCGKYCLEGKGLTHSQDFSNPKIMPVISYWIRKHQAETPPTIDKDKLSAIIKENYLPSNIQQVENLINYFGDNAKSPSDSVDGNVCKLVAVIGCSTENDIRYHLDYLKHRDIIYVGSPSTDSPFIENPFKIFTACLTHLGWEKYYELQRTNVDSRLAFMAMQYDNEVLKKLFRDIIIPAVRETGYEIRKLDDVKRAGLIDDKLRVEIRRSKFVLSDLTDDNRGAYWEAGFAEGLGIQVIYLCEENKFNDKDRPTHFDTNHHLAIKWNADISTWPVFAEELKATIRDTFPKESKYKN